MWPNERTAAARLDFILYVTLVPAIAHLMLSSLGFNPTDDGFTLAYARRILDGQVPYRDFIIIRPPLSPLLHTAIVRWGGDYTYWFSRFVVWLQLALTAWLFVAIVDRLSRASLSRRAMVGLAIASFVASTHVFPIMAWHTIDGLLLLSAGLTLCLRTSGVSKFIGYTIIGLAYLCKQSFVVAAPAALVLLGDARHWKYWLAVVLPGLIFALLLVGPGLFETALLQMTSQTNLLNAGFLAYVRVEVLAGFVFGFVGLYWARAERSSPSSWTCRSFLIVAPAMALIVAFLTGRGFHRVSFYLFGLVLGALLFLITHAREERPRAARAGLLTLVAAWSASLSVGYNSPVLMSGPLLAWLALTVYARCTRPGYRKVFNVIMAVLGVTLTGAFAFARTHYIYRDQSANNLVRSLDHLLPGGTGVRTNPNTYAFLEGLARAQKAALERGTTFAIIPDCAGYWVQSRQSNPLPIDWVQSTELHRPTLVASVIATLEATRDSNIVIVQKVAAETLAQGFLPLKDHYAVVRYVRENFTKVADYQLFELYR